MYKTKRNAVKAEAQVLPGFSRPKASQQLAIRLKLQLLRFHNLEPVPHLLLHLLPVHLPHRHPGSPLQWTCTAARGIRIVPDPP